MPVKFTVGERIQLKKPHACGGDTFVILRVGMDFRIQCETCNAQIWMNRPDLEKRVKKQNLPAKVEEK